MQEGLIQFFVLRGGQAVNHDVEPVARGFQGLRQPVDIGLLLHVAREKSGRAEFAPQFLDCGFGALVLIGEQQLRAFARERLRDGVGDAPLIPYTENDCRFAFE